MIEQKEQEENCLPYDMEGLKIVKNENGESKINSNTYQLFQLKPLHQFLEMICQQFNEKNPYFTSLEWKILYWAILKLQRYPITDQPQHLDSLDKSYVKQLREMRFSYEDIAFVLDRSKSSVYEYAQKEGIP